LEPDGAGTAEYKTAHWFDKAHHGRRVRPTLENLKREEKTEELTTKGTTNVLKSFCLGQNEANHGTHSVFCRENGWISLSRLAGVSGAAGHEDSIQNTGVSIQDEENGAVTLADEFRWRTSPKNPSRPSDGGKPQVAFRAFR
jgi:hypothetical protein